MPTDCSPTAEAEGVPERAPEEYYSGKKTKCHSPLEAVIVTLSARGWFLEG